MGFPGICIGSPLNMGVQTGDVVWCSSGIIFGSQCDGGLWLGQVEHVSSSFTIKPL